MFDPVYFAVYLYTEGIAFSDQFEFDTNNQQRIAPLSDGLFPVGLLSNNTLPRLSVYNRPPSLLNTVMGLYFDLILHGLFLFPFAVEIPKHRLVICQTF